MEHYQYNCTVNVCDYTQRLSLGGNARDYAQKDFEFLSQEILAILALQSEDCAGIYRSTVLLGRNVIESPHLQTKGAHVLAELRLT